MTPPRTNMDKQAKRHRGPIVGITLGLVFVALVAVAAVIWDGWPLSRQAAPDGVPTETVPADPEAGSGTVDAQPDTATE